MRSPPDTLAVYDASFFAEFYFERHYDLSSGTNPIKLPAMNGSAALTPPAGDAWDGYYKHVRQLTYLGRLGDAADFARLPQQLQTPQMAAFVGALAEPLGYMACGSPGEVANEPSLGHRYGVCMYRSHSYAWPPSPDQQLSYQENGKQMVWYMTALTAADQLRQRTAWALAQTFVLSEMGGSRFLRDYKAREVECFSCAIRERI